MRGLTLALLLAGTPLSAQDFTTLKGHGGPIMALAVSAQGQVASASFDNSVGLWEGRTPRWLDGHAAAVSAIAPFGPGRWLSGGDDFALRLWEGGTGVELGRHKGKIMGIAAAPDGQTVATASWDGTIGLWSVARSPTTPHWTATRTDLTDHRAGVNAVAFSDDGSKLYSASSDGTIRVWDTGGASSRVLAANGFAVNELAVDSSEGWLAYGAVDGVTRIIDAESGETIADFTLDRRPILALAYHAPTHQLAVGDGEGYIMVIDTAEMRIARDFRAMRDGPVWALAFSPDGGTIWTGGINDVVYGWPVALLDELDPAAAPERTFLRDAETMPNGERQFMRKCSICHALDPGPSRKAGPTLHGVFGRRAGTVPGYLYSPTLDGSDIVWTAETIDALFDLGPDHYIPGSKMPMQVIAGPDDRADLIAFLQDATTKD